MAKKRTRKEKEHALHQFAISWKPNNSRLKKEMSSTNVNSQLPGRNDVDLDISKSNKLATFTEKNVGLASIKKDLLRSLILVAVILASEIMIYLNWTKILSTRFGFFNPNLP